MIATTKGNDTMKTSKNAAPKRDARISFNSGFWDAMCDRERNNGVRVFPLPAWDKAYCEGYRFGKNADAASQTSDAAWTAFRFMKSAGPFAQFSQSPAF